MKDVFEWSSKQIAETLGISPAAVNSALQRARETMVRSKLHSNEFSMMDVEPDRELLSRYVEAFEQFDINALVALFHEEVQLMIRGWFWHYIGRRRPAKF
ncbi:hypothetical protein MUG84_17025 [Paenibacillus sp. KQZ6P-2]|uniref:RNA polymerase sigma factor 70 region 4 type 2 domain-containing protein n=1 Tax=Paenibacillus mangrovi TaxID=2931978 RepID=A0A9X1WQB1_9BACL|nr:sigma factor-like helix-turn-helix DNA-binding protein [Paenibacillus mangrovi]MCJ8013432.1 hypothetical protein [Paenibacillus mangrovi]